MSERVNHNRIKYKIFNVLLHPSTNNMLWEFFIYLFYK
jgi:hypothetical protein